MTLGYGGASPTSSNLDTPRSPVGQTGSQLIQPDSPAQLPIAVRRPIGAHGSVESPDRPRSPVPLRPMTMADLLDGGFAVIRSNPRVIAVCALLVAVPAQFFSAWMQRGSLDALAFGSIWSDPSLADDQTGGGWDIAPALVQSLGVSILAVPLMLMLAGAIRGSPPSDRDLVRAMFARSPVVLVAWLLVHVLELLGVFLFIVGALLAMGGLLVTVPALAAERLGPVAAMKRSWTLTSSRRWQMVGLGMLSGLVVDTLSGILALVPTAIAAVMGPSGGWLVLAAGNTAVGLLTMPLAAAIACVAYVDLRVRTEGLDLEMDARAVFKRNDRRDD